MAYGDNVRRVLEAISELGPMTAKDIAQETNIHVDSVSMVLTRCRLKHKNRSSKAIKRVYIHSWVREAYFNDGKELVQHRMVFGLGSKKDAPKPKPQGNAERCKKSRDNKLRKVSNIFDMGHRATAGLFSG